MDEPDYYKLLGVSSNATLHEIRTTFRQKVLAEHPDKGGDPKRFQLLNKAYNVLTDQEKRKRYDMTGRTERSAEEEFAENFGGGRMRVQERPKEADAKAVVFQDRVVAGTSPSEHEDGFAEWLRQRDQSEMVMTDKDFMKTALFNAAELAVKLRHQGPVQHVLGASKADFPQAKGKGDPQVQVKAKPLKKSLDHDEILVRMIAVPVEAQMVQCEVAPGTCLGSTGVGRVEQVGSRCEEMRPDMAVLVLPRPTKFTAQRPIGTARTLLICQEEDVLKIPPEMMEELTPEQICLMPSIVAAYMLLELHTTKLQAGDSILLNAAQSTDCGNALLQIAKLLKLKPLCIVDLPGAPSVQADGEYSSSSVFQEAETPGPAPLAVKEEYDQVAQRLQSLGAEEIFPNAVELLRWRDRNQRMRPKVGFDGLSSGIAAEQLIHCLAGGDKEGQLVVYGADQGAPLEMSPVLVGAWGGDILGFHIARWVHEPGNQEVLMEKVALMTKLVRANKYNLDTLLFKVGEDSITDAFKKHMDAANGSQVVLIFPTLQEEAAAGGGGSAAAFSPEPRSGPTSAEAESKAAKERKADEERLRMQDDWLRLLFTSKSVAAENSEGPLPVAAEGGDRSNAIALVVWMGDNPKREVGLIQDVMTSFPSACFIAPAWTGHQAGDALADLDVNSSEVCDGSYYLRGKGAFENSDLDNLHETEVLGRSLVETVQNKLNQLQLSWKNVVLCGFGKGAGLGLYASVLKLFPDQIAGMILFSPVVLFPSFLGEKIQTRPMLGPMANSKLYLIWGAQNRSTPSQYKQLLTNTLKKASEVQLTPDTLPEGDHSFTVKSSSMLASLLPLCLPR
mmetsp:Transcript_9994/g.22367  ORF Transcript_9994/g.22367 Transcript_9994/m.22367 type:complete len:844 (-) Transcript_9994:86-2617(-)